MPIEPFPSVFVYADETAAPPTRPGWPEHLTAALRAAGVTLARPVVSAARGVGGFADAVRLVGSDHRALPAGTTAVLALSHLDGRGDRLAPLDAGLLAAQGVAALAARWADRVIVVGPTGAAPLPGQTMPPRYGGYLRWHRRTEAAVRAALVEAGVACAYVSLADLPADLTRDGVRPTPAGWRWAAERVAAGIAVSLAGGRP